MKIDLTSIDSNDFVIRPVEYMGKSYFNFSS